MRLFFTEREDDHSAARETEESFVQESGERWKAAEAVRNCPGVIHGHALFLMPLAPLITVEDFAGVQAIADNDSHVSAGALRGVAFSHYSEANRPEKGYAFVDAALDIA